jgi:hypothetical protein
MAIKFATSVDRWELLLARLKETVKDLPGLEPEQQQFEALVVEAKALQQQQEELRANLRKTYRLRQEVEQKGNEMRSRFTAVLQGKFGFKNEDLIAYGIRLRKKAGRRKKEEEPETVPPPVQPAPGSSTPQ